MLLQHPALRRSGRPQHAQRPRAHHPRWYVPPQQPLETQAAEMAVRFRTPMSNAQLLQLQEAVTADTHLMQLIHDYNNKTAERRKASEQAQGTAAHLADSSPATYEDGLRAALQEQGIPADAVESLNANLRSILDKVLEHAYTVCDTTLGGRKHRHCHTCTRRRRVDKLLELTRLLERAQAAAATLQHSPELPSTEDALAHIRAQLRHASAPDNYPPHTSKLGDRAAPTSCPDAGCRPAHGAGTGRC